MVGFVGSLINILEGNLYIDIAYGIFSLLLMYMIRKKIVMKLKEMIDFICYTTIAILLGVAILIVDNKNIINLLSSYWKLFLVILLVITILFIREFVCYFKTKEQIIKNYCKVLYLVFLTLLFTFVVMNMGLFWILSIIVVLFCIWGICCGNFKKIPGPNDSVAIDVTNVEESDVPVDCYDNLFPTRRKELDRVYVYLKGIKTSDPYAIAISAGWGEGKTSIITVLQKKLKEENVVIYVQPMILDTREKLLHYVFGQLEKVLIDNKIYTGKGSPYKKYFDMLLKFLEYKTITSFTNFFNIFPDNQKQELREAKVALEKSIQRFATNNKRIYIIIDDLDRVEKETIYGTLTFIKEIVDLKKVTVLFLVDYKKIISEQITIDYLEKFINQKFELSKIEDVELFKHYFKALLPLSLYSKSIVKQEIELLSLKIDSYVYMIKKYFEVEIESIEKVIEEDKEENIEINKSEVQKLKKISNEFQHKISNARYVKKIVLNIKESFKYMEDNLNNKEENFNIENNEIEFSELIFKLNTFKVLFKEEYDELLKSKDVRKYLIKVKDRFINPFLRETSGSSAFETENIIAEIKYDFYNSLIFLNDISEITFQTIKSKEERLLEKIDSGYIYEDTVDFEKVKNYLNAINNNKIDNSELLQKRIETFTKLVRTNLENDTVSLHQIFELFTNQYQPNVLFNSSYFLNELKQTLNKATIRFINQHVQEEAKSYIRELEETLTFKILDNFKVLLAAFYLSDENITYKSLDESLGNDGDIEKANRYLYKIFEVEENRDEPIECFELMFNKVKEKVDSSEELDRMTVDSCQYYEKIIRNNIEVYKANSEVFKIINEPFLENKVKFKNYKMNQSLKEIYLKIDELYVYLINEGENKNRDIFSFTHRLLNDLGDMSSSSNVIIDDNYILRLSKIVENLEIYHKQHSDVYDTNVWHYCKIRLAEINQLNKIRLKNIL
ncbi:hypothetical protein C2L96_22350 [Bacillus cereus]|nr:hypothetical protein C2L96_22350 [Bacillus cereus]